MLAACVAFATASASAQVGKSSDLWRWTSKSTHHDAVVRVVTTAEAGYKEYGTGALIRVDRAKRHGALVRGYVLTAHHVTAAAKSHAAIDVALRNGFVSRGNRVAFANAKQDIAIVSVWVPSDSPVAKLASRPVVAGDKLEFCGFGGRSKLTALRHFSGKASLTTDRKLIYADVALLAGDSGGPVFNDRHEVVGVISGGWQWFDKGLRNERGHPRPITWPARASNVDEIRKLLQKLPARDLAVAERK